MKKEPEIYESQLNAAAVDKCSEYIRNFLSKINISSREIMRYAMSAEEILLEYFEDSEIRNIRLKTGKKFSYHYITLEIDGNSKNIYAKQESEQGLLNGVILRNIGLFPEYSYKNQTNIYTFRLKNKPLNPFVSLAISISSALIIGTLGKLVPDIASFILENILTPLYDAFFNILGCIACPMVFLSVAWGIYGLGDAATLKRVGKKLILGYTGTVLVITALFTILLTPFFDLKFSGFSGKGTGIFSIFSMLLEIIPHNIFEPFINGNTLQIIFIAVIIGIAMLILAQKTTAVAKAVEQINYIVNFLIELICKLVPYFIFIVVLNIIWTDTFSSIISIAKLFMIFAISAVVFALGFSVYTGIKNSVSPITVIKKGIPAFIIAFTTASSAASFGTNINTCRTQYGISKTITSFGLPLGMVTFKPTTSLSYVAISLAFAEIYNIDISVSWIVFLIISAVILAIATPPIPGGAMTAYTVLFAQLGIPSQALAIAITCDVIFDFISTGFDQYLIPLELLNQAGKLGVLDKNILKSKTKTEKATK